MLVIGKPSEPILEILTGKFFSAHTRIWLYIRVCIYIYISAVYHKLESTRTILRTRLERKQSSRRTFAWIHYVWKWSSIVKKTASDSKAKGKKPSSTPKLCSLIAVREKLLEFYSD